MLDLYTELDSWLSQRSLWIQNAVNRIINNNSITQEDINDLVILCKKEAGLLKDDGNELKPIKFLLKSSNSETKNSPLIIESISDLNGMFALAPQKPLLLGKKQLTVVYGRNGSGKTSYVRILKHICGSQNPGKLLKNVFEKDNQTQSCTIDIKIGNRQEKVYWKQDDGAVDKLKDVEIYDTDSAFLYVNSEKEVTFEPQILMLFTDITNVCAQVGEMIQNDIENNPSKKPILPKEYINTDAGKWYNNLSLKNKKEVDSKCQWNEELEKDLQSLKQRLNTANPLEKAKSLRVREEGFKKLTKKLKELETGFRDEICEKYLYLKNDANLKKKTAQNDVDKVFSSTSLEGIGTDSWKLLWEQARLYSEKNAYTEKAFPNVSEGARCVLCQQPLSEEAKKRLVSFEEFVKGSIQKKANEAEDELNNFTKNIIDIPNNEVINLMISSCEIIDEEYVSLIKSAFNGFALRKNSLLNSNNIKDIYQSPDIKFLDVFEMKIETLEEKACTLDEDAKNQRKDEIKKSINDLESKKWLNQQKNSVEEEMQRLSNMDGLEKARRLTNTQAFTIKKSDLSNKLITEEYVKRFQNELKLLGANQLKIQLVKTRAQKGHIFHQIKLKNCKENVNTCDVLSEGERRIVSLAAFLADVESREKSTPFIFDDPISSLDQDYEEATVDRLVELSKSRQVIIFTHRLSLLSLIEASAKNKEIETYVVSLRNEYWGAGEPSETPINAKNPPEALNSLINDRLSKAAKTLKESGQAEYDILAKAICSDFRIIIERFIENNLLCDVVQRFRRSINTLGKLDKISLITMDDCKLFDNLMTKYSRYEHSQSSELLVYLPSIDELKEDMEKLRDWNVEFKKRTKK